MIDEYSETLQVQEPPNVQQMKDTTDRFKKPKVLANLKEEVRKTDAVIHCLNDWLIAKILICSNFDNQLIVITSFFEAKMTKL